MVLCLVSRCFGFAQQPPLFFFLSHKKAKIRKALQLLLLLYPAVPPFLSSHNRVRSISRDKRACVCFFFFSQYFAVVEEKM